MSRYIEKLLAEAFQVPVNDPKVQAVVQALKKDHTLASRLETIDLHAKVDQLRAHGVPCADIAKRLGMSRQAVTTIVRDQLDQRKAG